MSGPFGSSQWMYSSGAASFYGTEIDGSLRFNASDSAYLSRTPSAGNRQTWTWSAWAKLGDFDNWPQSTAYIFSVATGADNTSHFYLHQRDTGQLRISGYSVNWRETTARYRDHSAWYHIVLACDSTQATAQNRIRLYINGEEVTAWDINNDPSPNQNFAINMAAEHRINQHPPGYNYPWGGYMAEINFVDGQQLSPTSFGETKSGVWIPKAYSGSYGTNGFHLEFAGNANDSSGNGNNWTANNISSYDYVPDSPTNNFATLNPLGTNDISSFSQGNLKITTGSGASSSGATMGMSSGKWYAEFVCTAKSSVNFGLGITKANTFDGDNQLDEGSNVGYFLVNNANVYHGFASDSYGASFNTGDIMGIAFDADTLALQWYKNGVGQGNYTRVASENTAGDHWIFGCGEGQGGATATFVANFGQDSSFVGNKTAQGNSDENGYGDFYYTPPSGYLALCTANLTVAEGVDPAEDNSPTDHFSVKLYPGNSSTQSITGVGFSPDFVWLKARNHGHNPELFDILRGPQKLLMTSYGDPETSGRGVTSFDSDGFSLDSSQYTNQSGLNYVAWNWNGNGTGVSNTNGSNNTAVVSANTDAGISIVTYTGNGTTGQTIGHGLSQQPDTVWIKNRGGYSWNVWHKDMSGLNYIMYFNSTSGQQADGNMQSISSTTFGVSNGESCGYNNHNYVAYVFHEVEGFSSFGSYVGNGSADGPFAYTGFRPAYVMTKPINTASSWCIHDSARTPANTGTMGYFKANTADAENFSRFDMDFLSNGFKIKSSDADVNHNGGRVVYWAFAENPFKYANAR